MDKKSFKNIDIYYIGYMTMKDSDYVKFNSVNPLYLVINKANGCIEKSNRNKYLTLVSDENNAAIKIYPELWNKNKNLIEAISDKLGEYGKEFIKIKFDSGDNLLLGKILNFHYMTIVVRSVFQEDKKYYPQVFLDKYLYEL